MTSSNTPDYPQYQFVPVEITANGQALGRQYKNGNTFLYIGCGSLGMSIINIILNASLSNSAYDYDYDTYAFFASISGCL